jgi:hypothetical protein
MNLTKADNNQTSPRLPSTERDETRSEHLLLAALVQRCLEKGAWNLTDRELETIIHGILSEAAPLQNTSSEAASGNNNDINSEELKAITQCYKEQSHRREKLRAIKLLHRHRLVQRRFLELQQESLHKDKPSSEYVLKRRALEQIMQETIGQTHFPLAPTNDSLSQKIHNFAVKAQTKPYHDIGPWGFAILRLDYSDDAAWEAYKKFVDFSVRRFLLANDVSQYTCSQFSFVYLEDEAALSGPMDHIKLVKYWEKHQWDETIHLDINKLFFFSVDEHVRRNESTADPAIYIHDASVDEVKEGAFPGFRETSIIGIINWHIPAIEESRLHLRTVWEMCQDS